MGRIFWTWADSIFGPQNAQHCHLCLGLFSPTIGLDYGFYGPYDPGRFQTWFSVPACFWENFKLLWWQYNYFELFVERRIVGFPSMNESKQIWLQFMAKFRAPLEWRKFVEKLEEFIPEEKILWEPFGWWNWFKGIPKDMKIFLHILE